MSRKEKKKEGKSWKMPILILHHWTDMWRGRKKFLRHLRARHLTAGQKSNDQQQHIFLAFLFCFWPLPNTCKNKSIEHISHSISLDCIAKLLTVKLISCCVYFSSSHKLFVDQVLLAVINVWSKMKWRERKIKQIEGVNIRIIILFLFAWVSLYGNCYAVKV